MDSRNFVYAPAWVKTVALVVLAAALVSAILVSHYYIGRGGREDWILAGLSLAQIAASGLVIALVVFYSERDVNALGLQKRAEAFFYKTFPRALALIDYPQARFEPWEERTIRESTLALVPQKSHTKIRIRHNPGEIDAFYELTALESRMILRVQVNVSELAVSYYFPAADDAEKDRIAETLTWAFSRLIEVNGYAGGWYFSREAFDGQTYASIHLSKDFGPDFLENDRKKLTAAQDIAANTRGILKDCGEKGVRTVW
jgi:hypothetical protein